MPFDVLVERTIVGLVIVDQTTPLAVMDVQPSDVIFPPELADVLVIAVMAVVVSVGIDTIEFVSFRQRTEAPIDLFRLLVLPTLPSL